MSEDEEYIHVHLLKTLLKLFITRYFLKDDHVVREKFAIIGGDIHRLVAIKKDAERLIWGSMSTLA